MAKEGEDLHLAFEWLKFTAANGLEAGWQGSTGKQVDATVVGSMRGYSDSMPLADYLTKVVVFDRDSGEIWDLR